MSDTRQKIEKEISDLFKDVLEYRDSERFKELLHFCVKLNTLGSYNAMLVKMQCPGAKYVLSRQKWAEYNRKLIPDARPLMILAPFGPVSFVFDISQTESMSDKPTVKEDYFDELSDPFKAKGFVDRDEFETLLDNLKYCGVEHTMVHHFSNEVAAKIQVAHSEPMIKIVKWNREIPIRFYLDYLMTINESLSLESVFVAICHELGHLFCQHLEPPQKKGDPLWEVRQLSEQEKEFEAETVAWLVTRRHGIMDSKSIEYLAGYVDKDGKIPPVDVSLIMSAVDKIEALLQTVDVKKSWLYKHSEDFKHSVDEMYAHKESWIKYLRPKF